MQNLICFYFLFLHLANERTPALTMCRQTLTKRAPQGQGEGGERTGRRLCRTEGLHEAEERRLSSRKRAHGPAAVA